ncbi:MAG: hypothetical protein J2P37_30330, partial [Ktedonobacteraceae bacterium]|nr:hypothetical protein [Ktedonobacteraceae bacterium]
QQIPNTTSSKSGSSFNVGSTYAVTATALASPGQLLTVQVGIENGRGDPNTSTIVLTDSYSNNSFNGEAIITWDQDDTSTVWVQFSDFPLQADQVSPMDKCDYSISVLGTEVSAQVVTL